MISSKKSFKIFMVVFYIFMFGMLLLPISNLILKYNLSSLCSLFSGIFAIIIGTLMFFSDKMHKSYYLLVTIISWTINFSLLIFIILNSKLSSDFQSTLIEMLTFPTCYFIIFTTYMVFSLKMKLKNNKNNVK